MNKARLRSHKKIQGKTDGTAETPGNNTMHV